MNASDRPRFVQILLGIAAIKRTQLTAETMAIWFATMLDWTLDEFREAALALLRTSPYMPTPYDFEQMRHADRLTAGEAWAAALACAAMGAYRRGDTVGGLTDTAVAALGGYSGLGRASQDDLPFLEKRFAAHFEELRDVNERKSALMRVNGVGAASLISKDLRAIVPRETSAP